jgi:membrane-associated phospholipid phosphatase
MYSVHVESDFVLQNSRCWQDICTLRKEINNKMEQIIINRAKHAGILIVLALIVNFAFSIAVYASDDVELAGEIIGIILPLTAGGMAVYHDDQDGLIQFSKSFLATCGASYALKYSINTERPNGETHSFPSGLTSMAFSGASFLQRRYGLEYGIPAYVAASFVGWSRIESDNHYLKDVLAGAALGVISTYIFTDPYQKGITATPFVGDGQYGMLLSTTF